MNYDEYLKGGEQMPDAEPNPAENQPPRKEPVKEIEQADGAIEDLGLELPDILLPTLEPERPVVQDEFKGQSAFRIAVVGLGQGVHRINYE